MNQWRSPTAEKIFSNHPDFSVRSAGTSHKARRTVTHKDIKWADFIFVMENKHRSRIQSQFDKLLHGKKLYVLDIPDEYQFMDPELIQELTNSINSVLENQPED